MATIVFDDNAGGGDGLWSTNTNWVGDALPGTADTAQISADCTLDMNDIIATFIIDSTKTLTMNATYGLSGLTGGVTNNGTIVGGAGCSIKGNTASNIYLMKGKSLITGTSGSIFEIQNTGSGNAYIQCNDDTVWKWVDAYAVIYDSPGQNVIWEDVDLIAWTSMTSSRQPVLKMTRCFVSGYSSDFFCNNFNNSGHDPQWENIVVGYRRDGTAAAVTRAFVIGNGRITIRNFVGNYTTMLGANGEDVAVVIENNGYVDDAMLPGTASALDTAVVDPGVSFEQRHLRGSIERSTSAKKAGTYGSRLTPDAALTSGFPLELSTYIPIESGDNVSISVFGRRHTMTSDCAEIELDPEGAWFTPDIGATTLTTDDTWYEFTATGTTAGGTGAKGTCRVVLRLLEYQSAAYFDWADFVATVT